MYIQGKQTVSKHGPFTLQGEAQYDRLKRELEALKNQPRGLEGTFRIAAEMERHRAQLADAAIEEQLEVQTAFRDHGASVPLVPFSSCSAEFVLCPALFALMTAGGA